MSNRKTNIISKDFANELLYAVKKFSDRFYEDFGQRAQVILGIKLDEMQTVTLKREIFMLNMWAISKVLSPDKEILDELHKIYLLPHINEKQIKQWLEQDKTENLKNVLKQDESELNQRYAKYYANWDDKSGGNQSVLAITILEYMFNGGKPDRRFVDARLIFEVNGHIFDIMKFIIDFRKKAEKIIHSSFDDDAFPYEKQTIKDTKVGSKNIRKFEQNKNEGKCPYCRAELIFEPEDLIGDSIECPTCFKKFNFNQSTLKIKMLDDESIPVSRFVIKNKYLVYFFAIIACVLEILLYAIIGALLGWENGGGVLLMTVFLGILIVTWKKIVGLANYSVKN